MRKIFLSFLFALTGVIIGCKQEEATVQVVETAPVVESAPTSVDTDAINPAELEGQ